MASDDQRLTAPQARLPASSAQDEESYLDQPIELDLFDDDGNDDEEASDLIVGEEIDLLGESIGDNEPIELDLGTLVGTDDVRGGAADDDDSGFEVDPAAGLALPDALTPDDGTEGTDDGAIVVDESKFPTLESDDGSEGIAAEREISLANASDEARVPVLAVPWQVAEPLASLEACHALSCGSEGVVAGSSDLLWFSGDSRTPWRLAVDGSALCDLVLVGQAGDIALASTQSGQLFRRARFASQAEQLTRFRELLRSAPGSRVRVSFAGSPTATDGRLLLWSSDGALLEVLDNGDRFERVEVDGKVVAAARESATVLLARGQKRAILCMQGERRAAELVTGDASLVAQSAAPLLATSGDAIALAEYGKALWVSPDRGKAWQRVAGSANVTAIAGAPSSGIAHFFAALYRETSDQSEILRVDAALGEAVCIARLEATPEHLRGDTSDRGEWAKITRLAWHEPSARLWAAGGFGVVSFGETSLT